MPDSELDKKDFYYYPLLILWYFLHGVAFIVATLVAVLYIVPRDYIRRLRGLPDPPEYEDI